VAVKVVDVRHLQHEAVGKRMVRGHVLVARAARVEQQLQRQRQAGVACHQGRHRGQRAAGTVAADGQPGAIQSQRCGLGYARR
jgi:hypothetical protein